MENKLTMLKSEFNGIIAIKTNVQNVFDVLQVRINKLKLFSKSNETYRRRSSVLKRLYLFA